MKFLFIFAHLGDEFPRKLVESIGKHLKKKKHEIRVVDLYKIKFNPVNGPDDFTTLEDPNNFDYPKEQKAAGKKKPTTFCKELSSQMELIKWCDNLYFFFPLTNYNVPTILKGYLDKVYAYYFAFGGLTSLTPRKFMFLVHNPKNVPLKTVERYFSNLYQVQNVCGVRKEKIFVYNGENEKETLKKSMKHVDACYSFSNKFVQYFQFPRLKMFGMFLK